MHNKFFVFVAVVLFWPVSAWACSCSPSDVDRDFASADRVVIAKQHVRDWSKLSDEVSFDVLDSFKGDASQTLTLNKNMGMCDFYFTEGEKYLVFVEGDSASTCSSTESLANAGMLLDDVLRLSNAKLTKEALEAKYSELRYQGDASLKLEPVPAKTLIQEGYVLGTYSYEKPGSAFLEDEYYRSYHKNGVLWIEDINKDGKRVSLRRYHKNGVPQLLRHYKDGKLVMGRDYYANGVLESEYTHDGITSMSGYAKDYYQSGKLRSERHFKDQEYTMDKTFYENGRVKQETLLPGGGSRNYHPNGQLELEIINGATKLYDDTGKLICGSEENPCR